MAEIREAGLRNLRYPAAGKRPYPSALARSLALSLLALTAFVTGGLAVAQVITNAPVQGLGGLWGSVFFLGVICLVASTSALMTLRVRGFRVQNGVMTLVTPRKTNSGGGIRQVALTDIVSAEWIAVPGADPGIFVFLRDGTRIPIFEGDLPREGHEFLERLLAALADRPPPGP